MNRESLNDRFAASVVAVLLVLTAWGNALAMLVAAGIGLVVGVLLFRRSITRGGALAAIVGLVVAIAIGLVMILP
jgi:hypothetical protein